MRSEIHSFKITRTKMYLNTKSTKCDCLIHTYSHVPNRGDSSWEISVKRLPRSSLQCIYCVKKNWDQRPKIKSLTSWWKDRYRCRALHEKGHFFPGKIDLSIKSDSNLDFQHCDGTYQILFSQYFMPHVFPSDLLQWRILKRGL